MKFCVMSKAGGEAGELKFFVISRIDEKIGGVACPSPRPFAAGN